MRASEGPALGPLFATVIVLLKNFFFDTEIAASK